ncbi:MAG: hypothetical protein JWM95_379 [Gemmatimonadetes bacterium]|nr:hypothetical protein [Gemmatimonadota bacterium]
MRFSTHRFGMGTRGFKSALRVCCRRDLLAWGREARVQPTLSHAIRIALPDIWARRRGFKSESVQAPTGSSAPRACSEAGRLWS